MDDSPALVVAVVPGVTVTKWTRIWAKRHPEIALTILPTELSQQVAVVQHGAAELSFVRLPIDDEGLHVIPLYRERTVVVAAKDHRTAASDEITLADLATDTVLSAGATHFERDVFDQVAGGVGILIVPQSIARLQSREDVVVRPVTDAPETQIALVWQAGRRSDQVVGLIEEFIGIVRGRTERSSRSLGSAEASKTAKAATKPKAGKRVPSKAGSPSNSSLHARKRKQAAARKKRRGH